MGKLKQMLMPTPMPKLPNLLKHLEGPGEEEVAVLLETEPPSRPPMVLSVLHTPLIELPPPVSITCGSVMMPLMEPRREPVSVTLELVLVTGKMVMCPCCARPERQLFPDVV